MKKQIVTVGVLGAMSLAGLGFSSLGGAATPPVVNEVIQPLSVPPHARPVVHEALVVPPAPVPVATPVAPAPVVTPATPVVTPAATPPAAAPAPVTLPPVSVPPQGVAAELQTCYVSWTDTEPSPSTGVETTITGHYGGNCTTAHAEAAIHPGAVVTIVTNEVDGARA